MLQISAWREIRQNSSKCHKVKFRATLLSPSQKSVILTFRGTDFNLNGQLLGNIYFNHFIILANQQIEVPKTANKKQQQQKEQQQ